jgi:hypothetical protein
MIYLIYLATSILTFSCPIERAEYATCLAAMEVEYREAYIRKED